MTWEVVVPGSGANPVRAVRILKDAWGTRHEVIDFVGSDRWSGFLKMVKG
jgi:hypothetical protein